MSSRSICPASGSRRRCTAHQGAAEITAAVTAFSGQPGLDRPRAAANSLGDAIALKLAANGHV
jgi:hypothetical protein